MPAMATISVYSPRVRITAFRGGAFSTGRTTTRSTIAPMTNPEASATTRARTYEPPELITPEAMNVVNISMAPWAKFTTRVERQMSTSASATAA
jgi:hypothetical protein